MRSPNDWAESTFPGASDRTTGIYHLDIFREPHDGEVWICRRDETIRRPYAEIIRTTEEGIPYMLPEIVLLFKAKHDQPKDNADFAGALPLLDRAQRRWLADALRRVHPGHHWIAELRTSTLDGGSVVRDHRRPEAPTG